MMLLTKELERRFAEVGSQDGKGKDAVVIAKFFSCRSGWTWYATEYDPVDRVFFGLVHGVEVEFGAFSMAEFESVPGPLGIERDRGWRERTIGDLIAASPVLARELAWMS